MINAKLYVIDYRLHGAPKSFIIRAEKMDSTEAWHWAACDVGIGRIGRYGREKVKKTTRPWAEKFGVDDVRWRLSGTDEFAALDLSNHDHPEPP